MEAEQDWRRLAEKVTKRRNELGLTQGQVQSADGPSVATMRLIEGALQTSYRGNILGRLERALRWKPGSVDAILGGGEPTLLAEEPLASEPQRDENEQLILDSDWLSPAQKKMMLARYHRRIEASRREAAEDIREQIELLRHRDDGEAAAG